MAITRELAEKALDVVRETGSLRQACLRLGFDRRGFIALCEADRDFDAAYARAKAEGLDALVEETLEIADDSSQDTIHTDNGPKADAEWIGRSKLRIETRRWLAERMAPKKYGVKSALDLTSSDGTMTPVDTATRAARTAELLALAQKRAADIDDLV